MNRDRARIEFRILIERCGCSRAAVKITEEESKGLGIKPVNPSCTPKKCFPELYVLLYPKGGFNRVSHLIRR